MKVDIGNLKEFFGLYDCSSGKPIPLKNITASAKINHFYARVTYTQTYFNDSQNKLNTQYFFPISSNACYDGFRATMDGTVIEGKIREKEEAKQEFTNLVSKGNTAAYAEINKDTQDVMKV